MTEHDGVDEALTQAARVVLTSAARVGETLARVMQAHYRRAAETGRANEASYLAQRAAEQQNARTAYVPVDDPRWWERATPNEIAEAYTMAVAWRGQDLRAAEAAKVIEDRVQQRHGLDLASLTDTERGPALEHAEEQLKNTQPLTSERALADLAAAEAADRAASEHDTREHATPDPVEAGYEARAEDQHLGERDGAYAAAERETSAATATEMSTPESSPTEPGWDSPERRLATREQLTAQGHRPDAVEARMLADTAQAQPAEAIGRTAAPTQTRARAGRGQTPGKSVGRQQQRGLTR